MDNIARTHANPDASSTQIPSAARCTRWIDVGGARRTTWTAFGTGSVMVVIIAGLLLPVRPMAALTSAATATVAATATADAVATMRAMATPPLTATPAVTATNAPLGVTGHQEGTVTTETPVTARQQRVFDQFWNLVNDRYVYPDFRGINWPRVRTDTHKRIAAGMTDADFYALLAGLIDSFNDNHSNFLSPEEAKAEDAEYLGTGNYVGIGIISDINLSKHYVFVLSVLPASPAERAGLHAHDRILQIDGLPSIGTDRQPRTNLLRGVAGSAVTLTVQTPGQATRTVSVTRAVVQSLEPIQQRVISVTTGARTGARIGYLLVPSLFEVSVATRARAALSDLMRPNNRLDGLILDLRTNGGGTYDNLRALLGVFTSGTMGTLTNRTGDTSTVRVWAERIGNSQTLPLVVLTGPGTESFAEVLAAALQAKGRAVVIGLNSAGNIETLLSHEFEGGSRLWLAEEIFRLPNGKNFEGEGVTPDVRVPIGWDEFTPGNDPVIAAAMAYLTKSKP